MLLKMKSNDFAECYIMKLKVLGLLALIAIMFSCSHKEEAPAQPVKFAGSRLAAQVFNRWERQQAEVQEQQVTTLEEGEHVKIQKIHKFIVQVKNKY